jgi:hypothetical protein
MTLDIVTKKFRIFFYSFYILATWSKYVDFRKKLMRWIRQIMVFYCILISINPLIHSPCGKNWTNPKKHVNFGPMVDVQTAHLIINDKYNRLLTRTTLNYIILDLIIWTWFKFPTRFYRFLNLEKDFVVVLAFVIIFSTIEIPFLLVQVLKDGVSIVFMT